MNSRVRRLAGTVLALLCCTSCAVAGGRRAEPPARPAVPDTFADPISVSVAWLTRWCPFDWQEPINANVDRAARYQTTAGAAADRRNGDTAHTYRVAREQRLAAQCTEVSAARSPEAPNGADVAYVLASAQRTQLAAGKPFEVETVATTRRVLRQPDGRWLVDVEQDGG